MTNHDALTTRAALWAWAARAFSYPTAELELALRAPAERDRLAQAARTLSPDGAVMAALDAVWAALDERDEPPGSGEAGETPVAGAPPAAGAPGVLQAARAGQLSLAEEHTFLFGRHVRVPPYESSYVLKPGTDRSTHLAEIGGLYAAFGLSVSAARPEMPDHLGAECELLAVLLAKEAYALAQGWSSRAKLTRRARRKLVVEHLQRWLPAFAERLAKHHRRRLYPALAELLLQLLAVEERLLHAPRPPAQVPEGRQAAPERELAAPEDDGSALSCDPAVLEREQAMLAGTGSVSP